MFEWIDEVINLLFHDDLAWFRWFTILLGIRLIYMVRRDISQMIREHKKTPAQKKRERELQEEAQYIADEINRNAWWI